MKKEAVLIPSIIFNTRLGSLESIVKYLKEIGFGYSEIAVLINRDQRTIWNVYKKANEKYPLKFDLKASILNIPSSILKNRRFSVLESIALFLKEEESLSLKEIGIILKRNNKTIWTAYNRAKNKS